MTISPRVKTPYSAGVGVAFNDEVIK